MRILLFLLFSGLAGAQTFSQEVRRFYTVADGLPSDDVTAVVVSGGDVYAQTARGGARLSGDRWIAAPNREPQKAVRVPLPATAKEGKRSWALDDVRAAAQDAKGRVWFASPQGVGVLDKQAWKFYTGADGLPYDDFTSMAFAPDGSVWFGTRMGAIHFDGSTWEYRQGLRWLPDDEVRGIAVALDGSAWFATAKGVGVIRRRPMTFAEKAGFFEDEIDKRHRRTEYGYVLSVSVKRPGDAGEWVQHDSDNDGLWTAMYGAGECFAYAATKSETAKKRAKAAFEALRFLQTVTQGGKPAAPPGFIARTVLPTSGPNPNQTRYTRESDEKTRATRDSRWKVLAPRWPTSADGKWYWKADTSSDELDGHYFFYGVYYDLVADTEAERKRVRDVVTGVTDHLIDHNFTLVDWDGKPTRWAVFNPESLNQDKGWWTERGLNSLSMLAYLKVAEHMTGGAKYREAYQRLVRQHSYAMNAMVAKISTGPGSGNQSDDEMAFMDYYNLIRYETDPDLREMYEQSFWSYWRMERYELNPLFNFMFAATVKGKSESNTGRTISLAPSGTWREESLDSLRRYPLDRFNWRLVNGHRTDIVRLPGYSREDRSGASGYRRNGFVLPIDERYVEHWNHDPYQVDQGGNGTQLADGASFLLPYYMGLYHGFVK